MDYRFADKRKTLALGVYPVIALVDARKKRDEARQLLVNGVDPSAAKRANKQVRQQIHENIFEVIATEWHAVNTH